MQEFWQKIADIILLSKLEKRWQKVARALAVVVVFCTTYMLILPAITMDNESYCGMTEHSHGVTCYSDEQELICDLPEHTHEEYCFIKELATNGNVTDGNVTSGNADIMHIPNAENLTEEEIHTEKEKIKYLASLDSDTKSELDKLSQEDRNEVLYVLTAIDNLPTLDEFFDAMDRYSSSDDTEGEMNYYITTQQNTINAYAHYQNVEHLKEYITNADKMFELKDFYSNFSVQQLTEGTSSPVTFNYFNRGWSAVAPVILYGGSANELISTGSQINQYWNGIVVEYNSDYDYYYVSRKYTGGSESTATTVRSLEATTPGGFVMFIWMADSGATDVQKAYATIADNIAINDRVDISVDLDTLSAGYNANGYGTVTFSEYVPTVDTEEDYDLPVLDEPSDLQVIDAGGTVTAADRDVVVSKKIDGTDIENVFDITLTVQTKTEVQTFLSEPDMAVVIVMDVSNTMNTKFTDDTISRYDAAVTAASSFISQFAENTAGLSKIGFVAFNTSAHEIFALQPCSTTAQANALISEMETDTANIVDNYVTDDITRFTNVEGGLKRAYDMLKTSGNANQYVILLTDGFPTTYLKNNSPDSTNYEGYNPYTPSGTKGQDGVFYDYVTGYYCSYGTSYSDKASIKARVMAESIKNSGGKIFSVGVDVAGQTIAGYDGRTGLSVIDRTSTTYEIGGANDLNAYKNWLGNRVGSGYYYDSTDQEGITSAFNQIFAEIRKLNEQSTTTVWTTTDPLPVLDENAKTVEFIYFYDKNGNPSATPFSLTGSLAEGAEDTAHCTDDIIYWDIKKSGYRTEVKDNITYYNYDVTYRVRLQNELSAFEDGQEYKTNGSAYLSYRTIVTINGVQQISAPKTVYFPKPSVKGYYTEFSFTKKNNMGAALENAEFSLVHDTERCSICRGNGTSVTEVTKFVRVSNANGIVSFSKIPSGHLYYMVETGIPTGYLAGNATYDVLVDYDDLTITETKDGVTQEWTGVNNTIINYAVGHVLPETGGFGTYYLYIIGGLLISLSSVFLLCLYKKRQRKEGRRLRE